MSAAPLRIASRPARASCELGRLDRPLVVVRVPRLEQLDGKAAMGIVGLDAIDALNGITAAKREERVAAPFGPFLEAAKRTTAMEGRRVLPAPAPDRHGSAEQLCPGLFDLSKESGGERPLLGILASRIELADQEAPRRGPPKTVTPGSR